ncbi:MAG: helicase-related protein [Motilibacteraceae bacterium]
MHPPLEAADLVGPLVDLDGHYPSAVPSIISIGTTLDAKAVTGPLVADDGHEVLLTYPTAQYVVGALYPRLAREEEDALDEQQERALVADAEAVAAKDQTTPAGTPVTGLVEPADPAAAGATPTDDADLEDVTDDAVEATANGPVRPSSFAMSFLVAGSCQQLDCVVSGGRYEPYPISVSDGRAAWHRIPVRLEVPLPVSAGTVGARTLTVGRLALRLGATVRATMSGDRLVTVYVSNESTADGDISERVLFGAHLEVTLPDGALLPYPVVETDPTAESASLRLLYESRPVRAVGHGTDAVARDVPGGHVVSTRSLPVVEVHATTPDIADAAGHPWAIDMDALGAWEQHAVERVGELIEAYRGWIAQQRAQAAALTGQAKTTALEHLRMCNEFADDMADGWSLIVGDATLRRCFTWASAAMGSQRRSYAAATRAVTMTRAGGTERVTVAGAEPALSGTAARWRPFQLAFILANLRPLVDPASARRGVADVVWMPTGGGKTEAYLGLAAFTMLHRRLSAAAPDDVRGTSVMMRYTLRLLTAQQLQRAASLLCALEKLRLAHRDELGQARFSIGAWLGSSATPNQRSSAVTELRSYAKARNPKRRPFLLSRCPSCAAQMGHRQDEHVFGYRVTSTGAGDQRMQAYCPNPVCAFNGPTGLPVYEVDEDLYERPPTFLVATVDKFAMLAWEPRARTLFGMDPAAARRRAPGPDLVIQDELHLISGPLGSVAGMYEAALDQLCRADGGTAPHVVAATATTRAYARQAAALYACDAQQVRLVPPPGLSIDDSFFARTDAAGVPRVHVGICATGAARFGRAQMRVLSALAHAAAAVEQVDSGAHVDPYWTNVVFFGSLNDLGKVSSLLQTDARAYAYRLVRATGVRSGPKTASGTRQAVRVLRQREITGTTSGDASTALAALEVSKSEAGVVDLALATSVIEVGVDVERLGLLTVIRQPKTTSQYIQVSGRVGRNARTGPGLVVTVLNHRSSRDLSHYERFTGVHDRLYQAVEPATVTPFTTPVVTRALRAAVAAVVRQTRTAGSDMISDADVAAAREAAEEVRLRAEKVLGGPGRAVEELADLADGALAQLDTARAAAMEWGRIRGAGRGGVLLRRPDQPEPAGSQEPSWAAPTSMRDVDASSALRVTERLPDPNRSPARAPVRAAGAVGTNTTSGAASGLPSAGTSSAGDTAREEEDW